MNVTFSNKKLLYEDAANNIYIYETCKGGKTQIYLTFSKADFALQQGAVYTKFKNKIALEYQKIMLLGMGFVKNPQSILMLGFGAGNITTQLTQGFPKVKIDVVEINPIMPEVAKKYFKFQSCENVSFYIQDAHNFVLNASKKYDAIFLDVFNESYIPSPFLQKIFFTTLGNLLTANGILIINTFGNSDTFEEEQELISSVFENAMQIKSINRIIFTKNIPFTQENFSLNKSLQEKYEYKKYKNKFEFL